VRRPAAPVLAALAAFALGSCAPAGPPAPPRGILVLLVDCLRADHIAAGGSELGATPSIDSLAPEAVAFDRAFVQASWTRPSVPSLLTGLYPSEHGLTDFVATGSGVAGNTLAPEVVTIAEGLKAAGYRTALVGYQAQLSPRFGLDQGFDFFNNNTNGAGRIHKRFLDWLDEAPEQPFFGYLHYLDIHWPYCPPEGTYGKYDATPGTIALCENWRALREQIRAGEIEFSEADKRALAARYAEELLALDGQIGALFEELKKRGLWDDTLIVVTSDHGEELMGRGMIEHGHTMYEELLHVPFVWKLPASWGRARGRVDDTLIETRSLLPTLLEVVGQPQVAQTSAPSLMPWLLGRAPAEKPYEYVAAEANGMFSVRDERWKAILTLESNSWQLYDLEADPGEARDLAGENPEQLAAMQRIFRRWRNGLHPILSGATAVDQETVDSLRALGYLN